MRNLILLGKGVNPHENLALEEALMDAIQPGDAAMYLWQNKNTVVIGRNQNAWQECRCELLKEEGGVLARRSSGGGAVFHDLGNLNFTFAASPERYDLQRQLKVVQEALLPLGIESEFSGRNDILTMDGRKFSGNAFKHTRTCSMQHGTLLVRVDMQKLGRYLNPPAEKLKAKGVASVRSRVCNLCEFNPDITIEAVRAALMESFQNLYGPAEALRADDFDITEKYARYSSWAWNYGETPVFDLELRKRFDWGILEVLLQLQHGAVSNVHVYSDAMDAELPPKLEQALAGKPFGSSLPDAVSPYPDIAQWLREELPL